MRVNRPSPTRSTPVASGSRVPAWPTRRCEKMRRHRATASCDVQPASLSTTTMPIVSGALAPLPASGIVTPGLVRSARRLAQVAKDLLDTQAVCHGRIRLELQEGGALHPHLPADG